MWHVSAGGAREDCLFFLDCSVGMGCQVAFFLALWERSSEGSFGDGAEGAASPDDTVGIWGPQSKESFAPGLLSCMVTEVSFLCVSFLGGVVFPLRIEKYEQYLREDGKLGTTTSSHCY